MSFLSSFLFFFSFSLSPPSLSLFPYLGLKNSVSTAWRHTSIGCPHPSPESVAFIVALGTSVRSAARVNARITDHIGLTRPFQVYLGMYLNFFFLNVFFF